MKVSKRELDEMRQRVADGSADDNDRRLVELYCDEDGVSVRDGEAALGVTGVAEAEVIKGGAGTAPKKSTRSRTR